MIAFSEKMYNSYHYWEVFMPLGDGRYRTEKFEPKEYQSEGRLPSDQYEDMIDLVNGCRFSDTEYYVFMDGDLTDL